MSVTSAVCLGVAPRWAALAAGRSVYASPGWLATMSRRLGGVTVTIVVSENGEPVLAALASVQAAPAPREVFDLHYIFVSPDPPLPLTDATRGTRAELAGAAPPPGAWVPSLIVMLPGYECLPVGPGRHDPRLIGELVDAACAWAAGQCLRTVAFLYTRPDDVALAAALASRGFDAAALSVTWDLPVPAGGLPGYLAALQAKRRKETRRELALLDRAGVRIGELDRAVLASDVLGSSAVLGDLAALRCQLVRKYGKDASPQAERVRLTTLIREVGAGEARVVTASADGELVGFALFCPHGDTWYCLSLGYDYADPRSRLCYFGTAFYGAVPLASAAGARWLSYGQGAASAKRSRGCAGTPLTCWVRTGDAALAAAVRTSAAITKLAISG